MTFSCAQLPAATLSSKLTTGLGSQLSLAVALPVTDTSVAAATAKLSPRQSALPDAGLQSTVESAAQVITGAMRSITVMTWSQVELLPQSSVAVQVRVIALSPAQLPLATLSLSAIVTSLSQLSVALALPLALELLSASQLTVASAGQVIAGALLSATVMI